MHSPDTGAANPACTRGGITFYMKHSHEDDAFISEIIYITFQAHSSLYPVIH